MERNPIGWLQERTWSARLITWVWFGLVMSLYSLAFGVGVYDDGFRSFQTFLACGLVLNMAFSASGSFRRERETGLLELMLVAPLSVRQIMWGRVRGIWSQFGPAILLLLVLWIYVGLDFGYWLQGHKRGWFTQFWFFTTTFLTLPFIGLYFSLRYQNFLIATIASLTIGCFLPLGLATVMLVTTPGLYLSCFCEILLAWFLGRLLVRNLTSRTFAFQRGGA
jgi:ABC-type transport system involved in multi-copper enzyme maturation permease subunit